MELKINDLSLSAFMKMEGASLIDVKVKTFIFESELSENAWRIKFLKSESSKFDSEVRELRKFLKTY